MRVYSAVVLAIGLSLTWAGGLQGQTIEVQREVEVRLAVQRLGRGIQVGPSVEVLARYPAEVSWDRLQGTATSLRRLYGLLRSPE